MLIIELVEVNEEPFYFERDGRRRRAGDKRIINENIYIYLCICIQYVFICICIYTYISSIILSNWFEDMKSRSILGEMADDDAQVTRELSREL